MDGDGNGELDIEELEAAMDKMDERVRAYKCFASFAVHAFMVHGSYFTHRVGRCIESRSCHRFVCEHYVALTALLLLSLQASLCPEMSPTA